jgi:hypothetical protein
LSCYHPSIDESPDGDPRGTYRRTSEGVEQAAVS